MGRTHSIRSVAWLAILPASPFAAIICDAALHVPAPGWLRFANLGASVVLLALGYVLPALRPLRGYLRSIALLVLGYVILLQIENTEWWRILRGRVKFPNDTDSGCPADTPPPATIVSQDGDVPLPGRWRGR